MTASVRFTRAPFTRNPASDTTSVFNAQRWVFHYRQQVVPWSICFLLDLFPQAINTAGLKPTLDDVNFVGTVFAPANLSFLPVSAPSALLTKARFSANHIA